MSTPSRSDGSPKPGKRAQGVRMKTEDSGGLWSREINNCPPHMLPREFTQNAIDEVNGQAVNAKWFDVTIAGAKKLAFYNDAPGMTLDELDKFANRMSWSGKNKSSGNNGNFGIGSRMVGLKSNPHGIVVYTRVKGSPMLYAKIGLDDGGAPVCLEAAQGKTARVANFDQGTLTIFMGKDAKQNTAKNHYLGAAPGIAALKTELTMRYWDYPGNFALRLAGALNNKKSGDVYKLMSLKAHMIKNSTSYDAIEVSKNMTIHYALMPAGKTMNQVNSVAIGALGAVVYQNEVYDCTKAAAWRDEAVKYALPPAVSEKLWVVVELSGKDQFSPNSNRERLVWDDAYVEAVKKSLGEFRPGHTKSQRHVKLRNFTAEVITNRPAWVEAMVEAQRSDDDEADRKEQEKKYRELQLFLNDLATGLAKDKSGDELGGEDEPEDVTQKKGRTNPNPNPNPAPVPGPHPTPMHRIKPKGDKAAIEREFMNKLPKVIYNRDGPVKGLPLMHGIDVVGATMTPEITLNANFPWLANTEEKLRGLLRALSDDEYAEVYKNTIERAAPGILGQHYMIISAMERHCGDLFDEDDKATAMENHHFATLLGTAIEPLREEITARLKVHARTLVVAV